MSKEDSQFIPNHTDFFIDGITLETNMANILFLSLGIKITINSHRTFQRQVVNVYFIKV